MEKTNRRLFFPSGRMAVRGKGQKNGHKQKLGRVLGREGGRGGSGERRGTMEQVQGVLEQLSVAPRAARSHQMLLGCSWAPGRCPNPAAEHTTSTHRSHALSCNGHGGSWKQTPEALQPTNPTTSTASPPSLRALTDLAGRHVQHASQQVSQGAVLVQLLVGVKCRHGQAGRRARALLPTALPSSPPAPAPGCWDC